MHPWPFLSASPHQPWLEALEVQDSAAPFHDWNRRVNAECYAPNASARIMGQGGTISEISNNYDRISFNFGPTLLSWMEDEAPEVHEAIVQADARSVARFGQGNALAQVYNHLIMPLASQRDKEIQVVWGIRDFERRFGRKPLGMWLSETAVDTPSLEVLVAAGIKFTILAPRQARAVRPLGGGTGRR
jgi:alpha-amylase/alpha-mannosidase (GH57 family)